MYILPHTVSPNPIIKVQLLPKHWNSISAKVFQGSVLKHFLQFQDGTRPMTISSSIGQDGPSTGANKVTVFS